MASYLERYRSGECEQVWAELVALGDTVRNSPTASDARAVAVETMQRARRNIETLYQRLQQLGYQFECEKQRASQNPLGGILSQLTSDPLMKSAFGDVMKNLGGMQEQLSALLSSQGSTTPPVAPQAFTPPESDITRRLDEFERLIGPLPLSIRAWCEIVGSVDFIGDYPGLASYERANTFDIRGMIQQSIVQNPGMKTQVKDTDEENLRAYLEGSNIPFSTEAMLGMHRLIRQEVEAVPPVKPAGEEPVWWVSDPLSFQFEIDAEEAQWEMEEQGDESGQYEMMVAPDSLHKANTSGSTYDIRLPDAKADTRLLGAGDVYFLAYLRNSFAWGGFPGLKDHPERDDKLIAFLKEGLEPI